MAPIKNFFVASLGLLSMATSVFAVNAGKTALSVTCFDTTGGVGGSGRLEKIAQEIDSTAVNAIISGVGAANPNFSCVRGRGGGLTCKSSLRAANKNEATTEIRSLLTEVRSLERAHLAANPPAGEDCGGTSAAPRSILSSVVRSLGKLSTKAKSITSKPAPAAVKAAPAAAVAAPKASAAAAAAAAPKATSSAVKACTKPVKAKRGPPTVVAAWLARAHLVGA